MKQAGRYFIILVLMLVLWNTIIMKPLKIFTVFLHELGHAAMAVLFGYGLTDLKIFFNESGYVNANPKGWLSAFIIANGGYLGSVFFAIAILLLSRTKFRKYIIGVISIILLAVSFKYSGLSFTMLYSVLFAVFTIIIYMMQNEKVNEWVIDILGVVSIAYAIYDTFVDTILLQLNYQLGLINFGGKPPTTDATNLAQLTHIPAIVWGLIWLGIAIFALYATLLKKKSGGRKKA